MEAKINMNGSKIAPGKGDLAYQPKTNSVYRIATVGAYAGNGQYYGWLDFRYDPFELKGDEFDEIVFSI